MQPTNQAASFDIACLGDKGVTRTQSTPYGKDEVLYTVFRTSCSTEYMRIFERPRSAISPFVYPALPDPFSGIAYLNLAERRRERPRCAVGNLLTWFLFPHLSLSIHLFVLHYLYYKSAVMFNSPALRLPRAEISLTYPLNPHSAIKKAEFTSVSYHRARQTFYTQNITRKILYARRAGYILGRNLMDNIWPLTNSTSIRRWIGSVH